MNHSSNQSLLAVNSRSSSDLQRKMSVFYDIACSKRYIIYLHEAGYLQHDFSISRNEAKRIYNQEFRQKFLTKVNCGSILYYCTKYNSSFKDRTLLQFNEKIILNLLKNKKNFDAAVENGKNAKKQTLVSQSFQFRNKKVQNPLVTPTKCKICDISFSNQQDYEQHLKGLDHKFHANVCKTLNQRKPRFLKFSVKNFPNLTQLRAANGRTTHFTVEVFNKSSNTVQIKSAEWLTCDEVTLDQDFPYSVNPNSTIAVNLKVCPKADGSIYFPILLTTHIEGNQDDKMIAIELVFNVHDEIFNELYPDQKIKKTKPVIQELVGEIEPGLQPERNNAKKTVTKIPLDMVRLPKILVLLLNSGLKETENMNDQQKKNLQDIRKLLNVPDRKNCLTPINYCEMLDLLVHIEEHQISKDIRNYDCDNQEMVLTKEKLLQLEVSGLAEHRPSLIRGDSVYVKESKSNTKLYEGIVHKIQENNVHLGFSNNFVENIFMPGKKFYVSFGYNRFTIRVEHQAVKFTKSHILAPIFFPKECKKNNNISLVKRPTSWFNHAIQSNQEQQNAVLHILNKTSHPYPYLVFGPPGTGKTMTVVEAIKQIHLLTNSKILVCTPSNSAANEITKRLETIPTTDMIRYISFNYPHHEIPQEIRKFTNYNRNGYMNFTAKDFGTYRIVISTLCTASRLLNAGIDSQYFDYVIIDESGQATETETLIPIAGIVSSEKFKGTTQAQIVLVGDPRQLGPIIHSSLAKEYGFDISMLERLMNNFDVYKKGPNKTYNPNMLTKLIKNYRSHPTIIEKPNEFFYENELKSCGDELQINMAIGWDTLPNRKFPIIFHSVLGQDQRDNLSPSFFNVQEITVVKKYVEELIGTKMMGMKISQKHIGIISPYRRQVQKISRICEKLRLNDLTVGSIEQIQGQERLIIIISTVRSNPEFLKFDHKYHLGFLRNPKRFNVAITRAKALLIVIGNPNVLQKDRYWRGLIEYCKKNNAVLGDKFTLEEIEQDEEEICLGIQDLTLENEGANPEDGPNFSRGNI